MLLYVKIVERIHIPSENINPRIISHYTYLYIFTYIGSAYEE